MTLQRSSWRPSCSATGGHHPSIVRPLDIGRTIRRAADDQQAERAGEHHDEIGNRVALTGLLRAGRYGRLGQQRLRCYGQAKNCDRRDSKAAQELPKRRHETARRQHGNQRQAPILIGQPRPGKPLDDPTTVAEFVRIPRLCARRLSSHEFSYRSRLWTIGQTDYKMDHDRSFHCVADLRRN